MSIYDNIPAELRALPQWVCADMRLDNEGQPKKQPLNPKTGKPANINKPETWGTFEEAVKGAVAGYPPGFVFTQNDPFAIIDLDNKAHNPATPEQLKQHEDILRGFDTYTERSVSGTGYHIVVKGMVPNGINVDHIEVYSWGRMMIFTGNVVKSLPIVDYSEQLLKLHAYLNASREEKKVVELVDQPEVMDDIDIVNMAMSAKNADKYNQLCRGEWKQMGFPSASEADLALISMLCYYTKSNKQVERLFMMTKLGQRDNMHPTKFKKTLMQCRSNEPEPVDFSKLDLRQQSVVKLPEPMPLPDHKVDLSNPPGLMGQIAEYVYRASPRPVKDFGVMAAIGFLAGMVGRAYTYSNTGLNQYCTVIADTGMGKESMKSGIDAILFAVREKVPSVDIFRGPGAFASGQALNKEIAERPCFLSVMGEFGLLMKRVLDNRASSADVMFKQSLLKLFNSSGPTQYYDGTSYSDREKNTKSVRAPNVSILGEAAPKDFFEALSEGEAATGFVPRLLLYQYEGVRPFFNERSGFPPPPELVDAVAELASMSILKQQQNEVIYVQHDEAAYHLMSAFNLDVDDRMRAYGPGPISDILNRSHFKAIKLAALLAVSVNPHAPVITAVEAEWAIAFVRRADHILTTRFESGEIGSGDSQFEPVIRRAIDAFKNMSQKQKLSHKWPANQLDAPYIPFTALRDWCRRRDPFKNHKLGYVRAIEIALQDLIDAEILIEIPTDQLPKAPHGKPRAFGLGSAW